jgi:hypothetical protein
MADMNPALVAAAVALELASCLSFVVVFRLFFEPVPKGAARELAWTQTGSGALLPGGGVGSLAVGGWLLHLAGMPTRQIVQRSSGLFFLTSAINVLTLAVAGLLLLFGIADGPHDALRAGVPVLVAAASVVVLALPRVMRRISSEHPRAGWLEDIGVGIPAARQALARPSWRLAGAFGYLLFDICVLWTTFAALGPLPRWRRSCSPTWRATSPTRSPSPVASGSSMPAWSAPSRSMECPSPMPPPRCSPTTPSRSGFRPSGARSPMPGCAAA